jgi:hypothetical protein
MYGFASPHLTASSSPALIRLDSFEEEAGSGSLTRMAPTAGLVRRERPGYCTWNEQVSKVISWFDIALSLTV